MSHRHFWNRHTEFRLVTGIGGVVTLMSYLLVSLVTSVLMYLYVITAFVLMSALVVVDSVITRYRANESKSNMIQYAG